MKCRRDQPAAKDKFKGYHDRNAKSSITLQWDIKNPSEQIILQEFVLLWL